MKWVYIACLTGLALAAIPIVYRLAVGPRVGDRAVALDTLLLVMVGAVAVETALDDSPLFVNLLLVVALLAFIGTTATSRFIERYTDEAIMSDSSRRQENGVVSAQKPDDHPDSQET